MKKTVAFKGFEFTQYEEMENVKDSLEFESETQICTLGNSDYLVSLEVHGEVRVTFNDEVFRTPSDFPDELKALIRENEDWQFADNVYVGNNNWFELFLFKEKGGELEYITSEVVDAEGLSSEKLCDMLYKFYIEEATKNENVA